MGSGRRNLVVGAACLVLATVLIWPWMASGQAPDHAQPPTGAGKTSGVPLTVERQDQYQDDPAQDTRTPLPVEAAGLEPTSPEELELEGIVVSADGDPIAGAQVELQRRDALGFTSFELTDLEQSKTLDRTRTEGDGTFSFTVPRFRQLTLDVDADGFGPALVFPCYGGQFCRVVLEEGCGLEGTVSHADDQNPVEGAKVWIVQLGMIPGLSDNTGFATVAEVMTDARGYYRVGDLPHTELTIMVIPPGGVMTGTPSTLLEPGEVVRRDFSVESGRVFDGTVRDAITGQPIAGARVEDYPWSIFGVNTDESGRFELIAESALPLKVRAMGYGEAVVIAGLDAGGDDPLEVKLTPGGAVQGRVLGPDGTPLEDAYVAGVAEGSQGDLRREWISTRTDTEGRFRIEDLSQDMEHSLVARHPGYGAVAQPFPSRVQAAATVEIGDLVMRPASAVQGLVADQTGAGLPNVFVALERTEEAPLGATDQSTITDDQGVFRFGSLAPGTYTIGARREALNTRETEVAIADWGQFIEGVEIRMDVSLAISGRVRTPTGEIPGSFHALLQSIEEGGFRTMKPYYDPGDGHFEFSSVPEGTYNIIVSLIESSDIWGSGVVPGVAAGTTGVEVTLRRVAWIEGTVLDGRGEPAEGITVLGTWSYLGLPGRRPVQTGPTGRFRLKVGEGDLVELHVGSPLEEERPPGVVGIPDPEREVIVPGVVAGTRDLVIRVR